MPIINVMLWEGREHEQKKLIAQKITDCMVEIAKVPKDSVVVTFQDYKKSDWAEGGVLASEKIRIRDAE